MSHSLPPAGPNSSTELVRISSSVGELVRTERNAVHAVALWAGPNAADETLLFLTAQIRNPNTRRAHHQAISAFVA